MQIDFSDLVKRKPLTNVWWSRWNLRDAISSLQDEDYEGAITTLEYIRNQQLDDKKLSLAVDLIEEALNLEDSLKDGSGFSNRVVRARQLIVEILNSTFSTVGL